MHWHTSHLKLKLMTADIWIKFFSNLNDIRQGVCVLLFNLVYEKAILQYHDGIVFEKEVN